MVWRRRRIGPSWSVTTRRSPSVPTPRVGKSRNADSPVASRTARVTTRRRWPRCSAGRGAPSHKAEVTERLPRRSTRPHRSDAGAPPRGIAPRTGGLPRRCDDAEPAWLDPDSMLLGNAEHVRVAAHLSRASGRARWPATRRVPSGSWCRSGPEVEPVLASVALREMTSATIGGAPCWV